MADNRTGKLYEEIAAQMMEQIRSGALRPGDRLPPERALAEEYGVSRTAIREALRSMEMMGCVESHVGEGTYIKTPSLQEIVDPFSMLIAQNGRMGGAPDSGNGNCGACRAQTHGRTAERAGENACRNAARYRIRRHGH